MAPLYRRMAAVLSALSAALVLAALLGIGGGSSGLGGITEVVGILFGRESQTPMLSDIVWRIRLPRTLLAALVGSSLSLGGLVFQALLRNPLAEPYILGISGGSAVGAIIGILLGLARFPGVCLCAFVGSMATLILVLVMAAGENRLQKDALLLSGVMLNAFCSAGIMFLVSLTQDARLHNILFWLMGDLSLGSLKEAGVLAGLVLPCFLVIFAFSHPMNLLLMGRETAATLGVNTAAATVALLTVTSLMVSVTVSYCGLVGFVGLVMPHLLRLALGPDHRILVPACILGGGAYLILCDLLARILPEQGEMPTGVITAMIGAPLFILLLRRSRS
ncbi:MAG: FecCD family ABC transporter permease [Thermodesulfobacteriota bacterium]